MSLIAEYMHQEQRRLALVNVLKYLLQNYLIEDERAQGIAKQIIGGSSLDDLTEKQLYRFGQDIVDHIEVACEGHCDALIDIEELENAYLREGELDGLYCQNCAYDLE